MKKILYCIDEIRMSDDNIRVTGWSFDRKGNKIEIIYICNQDGIKCSETTKRYRRQDATSSVLKKDDKENVGYSISVKVEKGNKYFLVFENDNCKKKIALNSRLILRKRIGQFIRTFSFIELKKTIVRHISRNTKMTYPKWYKLTSPSKKELDAQKNTKINEGDPLFSILVPLYNTPEHFLKDMINSVMEQTYGKWELCLADGSDDHFSKKIQHTILNYNDQRIKYKKLDHNEGISENTNAAYNMSTGDFIVLFDHDDLLTPNALFEFANVIRNDSECDCIYSDEDKINSKTGVLFDPNFKTDFNIDMLCSVNYICHLFSVRKVLVEKCGAFNKEYDGAQDYDFILRMTEQARHIVHIPKILYHWRFHPNSTSANPESKLYAYKAGEKAILAHYNRVWPNLKINKIEQGISLGIYHTIWHFDEYPLISVIIPNMDHTDDLDKAIRSMIKKGTWPNLEFIIVENNSTEEETYKYYEEIQKEFDNVHVVYYDGEFNYSKINNFGVQFATGDYYLLMNNDIELIEPDSIKEMMGYCQRDDVGIVGARLLYSDNTIQHAGVVVGIGGIAGHAFKYKRSENDTYFNRAMIAQDYSAVTAAVLLVKKSVFDSVNGLDESFGVAFNDVDFCLRVRNIGKLIAYTPYACFHHYESKSRGLEDTVEKQARFRKEIVRFIRRYEDFLKKGDPYYNPNLTLFSEDYALKNINFEKIGKQFYNENELKSFEEDIKKKS